jgi:hypothetical protein
VTSRRSLVAGLVLALEVSSTGMGRAEAAPPTAAAPTPEPAGADPGEAEATDELDDADVDVVEADDGAGDSVEQRLADLEQRLADMQEVAARRRPVVTVSGYVDFGFFAPGGDGTGVVQDLAPNRAFPAETGYSWVFLGDLLAPAVNSRGEPADLGNLPGNIHYFDSIHSRGAPGFILNEVNLTLHAAVGENALATASVDFMPRSGLDFSLGDVFEVDLAQLEWMPTPSRRTSIFAGKMESVLGIEYRERKASQRFGITPSLIARYTTGTPLGVKFRSKLGDGDWLVIAGAITNGSSTIEMFHFYDEIDSNAGKTASGRLAIRPGRALELGVSGEYGAQDHALDSENPLWFVGGDLQAHLGPLELKAEGLTGRGTGETLAVYDFDHRTYGLRLNFGGYLEGDLMVTPKLGVLGRAEMRDARVWLGTDRLYITKGWRATGGLRYVANEHVVVKAEYLHNGEYGGVPQIRDDVFTSSLILAF